MIITLAGCVLGAAAWAADFTVVASFPTYTINGQGNPTLILQRGQTYTFSVSASGHPFYIKSVQGAGTGNAFNTGVTGNGAQNGTITFAVPANAPAPLFYNCSIHSSMTGTINVVDPPAPPTVRIVAFSVGANVIVKSTGTNGWNAVPEYNSNLLSATWAVVPAYTNTFNTGTNTTTFDRLDAICGSNVFLRIRNQTN